MDYMNYISDDGPHGDHEYESRRMSPKDIRGVWEFCYIAADRYVRVYASMRDPRRILIKHKWAHQLTKQLLAEVISKTKGEHKMIVRMSMVLVVAIEELKHESCTFSTEDIAERAYRIATQPDQISLA